MINRDLSFYLDVHGLTDEEFRERSKKSDLYDRSSRLILDYFKDNGAFGVDHCLKALSINRKRYLAALRDSKMSNMVRHQQIRSSIIDAIGRGYTDVFHISSITKINIHVVKSNAKVLVKQGVIGVIDDVYFLIESKK